MRRVGLVVVVLGCSAPAKPPSVEPPPVTPDEQWTEIANTNGIAVAVEHALYEHPGDPHFFVRVRISTPRAIGVDLRRYHEVFYPNQWGASQTATRTVIDERRIVLPPFDAAATLADFQAGALVPVAANTNLEYYEELNASGRADVDAQARGAAFVIVTMDGQLRVSDGTTAERVEPNEDREVAIATPVPWKRVPAGARTIVDH